MFQQGKLVVLPGVPHQPALSSPPCPFLPTWPLLTNRPLLLHLLLLCFLLHLCPTLPPPAAAPCCCCLPLVLGQPLAQGLPCLFTPLALIDCWLVFSADSPPPPNPCCVLRKDNSAGRWKKGSRHWVVCSDESSAGPQRVHATRHGPERFAIGGDHLTSPLPSEPRPTPSGLP